MSGSESMTLAELHKHYGATHYTTMDDGVTPQMVYKQITHPFNDGTTRTWWHYLSYANIWMGSSITDEQAERLLKPISEETT